MNKFIVISFLLLAGLTVAGCNVQRGKYVSTTSISSGSLASNVGCIDIVSGHKNTWGREHSEENLVYVLIISQKSYHDITATSSGTDFGEYATTLHHEWSANSGSLSVDVRWDRDTDRVSVGKEQFSRANGNVFVARLETNGMCRFQQVTNLGPHANLQQTLDAIRQRMPNDPLIRSAELPKE